MTFRLEWHTPALRAVKKLPRELVQRILEKLGDVAEDPFRYLEHFEGQRVYKLRIGDYRALVDVNLREQMLTIRHFDHRRRVYK